MTFEADERMQIDVLAETEQIPEDLNSTIQLYDKVMAHEVSVDTVCSDIILDTVQQRLQDQSNALTSNPTARLCIQYMRMVDLLHQFLKAERTGNWHLHLKLLQEMLPYFAAAGHNLYTKSVHIYLQQMLQLQAQHPDVYAFFSTGYHVIRRSDRYWAGLSSDLAIEQVLMRSMKATGGLTRGRGMTESRRTRWLLSMPACAKVNSAMQELTDNYFTTSEQHKDMTRSRQMRDEEDKNTLLGFLQDGTPFGQDSSLRNIATGITAGKEVTADRARDVGCKILTNMVGQNVGDHSFKKKDHVVTMSHKQSVKVDGENVNVDPQLLLQRLVMAAGDDLDVAENFKYELSTHPSALFEPNGLMRDADKPALADAIWNTAKATEMPKPSNREEMNYVLDGRWCTHPTTALVP